jgi:hypothetical protein
LGAIVVGSLYDASPLAFQYSPATLSPGARDLAKRLKKFVLSTTRKTEMHIRL